MATIRLRLRELLHQREEREDRRISVDELGQSVGVAGEDLRAMINNQADQVSLAALAKLCEYFHVMPGDLLRYSAEDTGETEVDAREIVDKWHQEYGSDEYPRH